MLKSQRDGNVEHYVIKVRQNTTKDGVKIMMENHCRIFQMNEAPQMGKPSVEEAICYSKIIEDKISLKIDELYQ